VCAGGPRAGRESNIGTTFGFSVGQCLSVCLLMPSSCGEDLPSGGSKDLEAFVSSLITVLPTNNSKRSELPRGVGRGEDPPQEEGIRRLEKA
jgi:hypothetical protein